MPAPQPSGHAPPPVEPELLPLEPLPLELAPVDPELVELLEEPLPPSPMEPEPVVPELEELVPLVEVAPVPLELPVVLDPMSSPASLPPLEVPELVGPFVEEVGPQAASASPSALVTRKSLPFTSPNPQTLPMTSSPREVRASRKKDKGTGRL